MPDRPVEYPTAEGQRIRVSVVTRGIAHPWSIAFLPNDVWLVTQTHGGLRVVRNGVLDPEPVAGVPEVKPLRRSGLLEVALHPRFAENQFVYLTYHKGLDGDQGALALARGRWDGKALRDVRDLFVTLPDSGTVSRMIFGPDGKIYMSTAGGDAQDPSTHAGKVLRLNEDGSVPSDNPFIGRDGLSGPRSSRSATARRWAWRCTPVRGKFGRARTDRTAATRSTSSFPAATTAGRS